MLARLQKRQREEDLGSVVRSLEALRGKKTTSRRPTDPWSIASAIGITVMDLGSVHTGGKPGQWDVLVLKRAQRASESCKLQALQFRMILINN